jgi:hypothetical protein
LSRPATSKSWQHAGLLWELSGLCGSVVIVIPRISRTLLKPEIELKSLLICMGAGAAAAQTWTGSSSLGCSRIWLKTSVC